MKSKIVSLGLVILITFSFILNPALSIKVQAQESTGIVEYTKAYSTNKVTTVTNGVGAIEAPLQDVQLFKDLENFTMNTTMTMTTGSSSVQGIFFIGDSTQNSNYITIYFIPASNKIGIESKTGGINTSFNSSVNISDGNEHKFTFTVSKGNYYRFYVDGKKVHEGSAPTTFSKGIVSNADHMMFGNGKRANSGNGYPMNGSLKNIELYNSAISEEQILQYHSDIEEKGVFTYKNAYYKNTSDLKYENTLAGTVANLKALDKGSITIRYRANSADNELMALFSFSDDTNAGKYSVFYVNPKNNSIGVQVAGTASGSGDYVLNNTHLTEKGVSLKNTNWHTVTVVKTDGTASNRYSFYIDGKLINFYSGKVGFLNNVDTATTISVGHVRRLNNTNNMPFTGAIDYVKVIDRILSDDEVKELHKITMNTTTSELDMSNAYKTEPEALFYSGYDKSSDYRIPSLLTTKEGTVIAAIDKRNQNAADWGNIDTMIRRKEVGATKFNEGQVILDLADNMSSSTTSAFLIDPSMVQDKETGRIFLLVDMFPESAGLASSNLLKTGTGYKKIDGKDYQLLYDASNNEYTIRENGKVYNADGNVTEYTIITECEAPYKELGNIYKNGEYKGNMYLFSGSDKGELNIVRTSYLWLMHSDDDGKTWSKPKDITPQVKKDWMKFIGTGPGVGIQIKNGNLVFPVYHTNVNVGASQASAVIVSEDKGETWTIGESPMVTLGRDPETMTSGGMLTESQVIQTNNGELKLFMRNTIANTVYVATSNNYGKTWYKVENDTNIPEFYCQLSVIDYEKDGKEYVMISNPSKSGRLDGKVYIGEVADNGNITWTNSQLLKSGHFQYSSLTQLSNGKFAVLYELDDSNGNIAIYYTEFDENWVKATNTTVSIPNPKINDITAELSGNNITIKANMSQKVLVGGNPAITLKVGSKTVNAVYVDGSGTDKLTFKATLQGDEIGVVTAIGINETNGILENVIGGKVSEINKDLLDLTKISNNSYSGVTYTTQHSSSTAENTDGAATNVIDGNSNTYWHSTWGNANINLPQSVTLELKKETTIYKLSYLPRQNNSSGRVKDFEILISTDGVNFNSVSKGTFLNSTKEQSIEFMPTNAKYVKFQVNYAYGGGASQSAAVAELALHQYTDGLFETANKSELIAESQNAKELIKGAYSKATITKVEEELKLVDEILNANLVSQNMVNNALAKLKDAEMKLIDISRISEVVSVFEGMNPKDYTNDSWEAYSRAIEEAKGVANTATTKKEVTDILIKVIYMESKLIKEIKVDKTALITLYENSSKLIESDYTAESWSTFKDSFIKAKIVIDNIEATQVEVDTALANLESSVKGLEDVKSEADKTELQAIYGESLKLIEDEYTNESWLSFKRIQDMVKIILDDPKASQEQINNSIIEFNTAIKALEKLPEKIDVSLLKYLVSIVEDIDLTIYAEKGQSEFKNALDVARKVLATPESNEAVKEAINSLNKAYLNLRLLPNKELIKNLSDFIEQVNKIDINNYSATTQDNILMVMEKAKALLANTNMTEEEVLLVIGEINNVNKLIASEEEANKVEEDKEENTDKEEDKGQNTDKEEDKEQNTDKEENKDQNTAKEEIDKVEENKEENKEDSKTQLPKTGSDIIYLSGILGIMILVVGVKLLKKKIVKE